jgi:putative peptidoglycan lipid II flippase
MTESKERIVRSAGAMSLLTLVSRVTGYIRDNLLAQILGAAQSTDAFVVAFRIPNLLRRLVGEGALTAAFVPTLSDYARREDRREMWAFASLAFSTLAAVLAVITAAGILLSPWLVDALAYGFNLSPARWDLTVALNRLMFPYIFFIALAALGMATLNTLGSFALPASTPIFLNLSIIAAAWTFGRSAPEPAYAFAWGVLAGGALQLLVQIPPLWRRGWRPVLRVSFRHPGVREVGRLMLPGIFGLGITQITLVVDSQFASFLDEGSVSKLYFAGRVNELALGSFAISISTVILPALARQASAGRLEELRETLAFGLRMVSFITIPSMVGLIVLREEVIRVLFERGKFDAGATAATAAALLYYALGLPAFAAVKVLGPAFYARKDTRTPVATAAATLAAHVALCFALTPWMGLSGIALADAASATLNAALLLGLFRRRVGLPLRRGFLGAVAVFAGASAVMGAACGPAFRWLARALEGAPAAEALALGATLVLASALYFGLCLLAGREEPARVLATMNVVRTRGAPRGAAGP